MNPILEEIYSTIIPSAPYIIIAYALIWVILLVFVVMMFRRVKRAEQEMAILEERLGSVAPALTQQIE